MISEIMCLKINNKTWEKEQGLQDKERNVIPNLRKAGKTVNKIFHFLVQIHNATKKKLKYLEPQIMLPEVPISLKSKQ